MSFCPINSSCSIYVEEAVFSYLDAFDAAGVTMSILFHDMLCRDAKCAQPMQDRNIKASFAAEDWVNVQRVVVSIESVQSCEVRAGLFVNHSIWLPGWWLISSCSSSNTRYWLGTAKASRLPHKCCDLIDGIYFSAVRVYDACSCDDQCSFALVLDVNQAWLNNEVAIHWQG